MKVEGNAEKKSSFNSSLKDTQIHKVRTFVSLFFQFPIKGYKALFGLSKPRSILSIPH